jgi:hypothetical protein
MSPDTDDRDGRCGLPRATDLIDLSQGSTFEGKRYPLVNPQRGIFKPGQMRALVSIRTALSPQ